MHDEAHSFCGKAISVINSESSTGHSVVLDVGGRDINGSIHSFLQDSTLFISDIIDDEGVAYVVDFSDYDAVYNLGLIDKFDICISTEVLEHSENWRGIVQNMVSATKNGGWVLITCATDGRSRHSAIDGHLLEEHETEYYQNVSESDFISCVSGLDVAVRLFEINEDSCDLYALLRKL